MRVKLQLGMCNDTGDDETVTDVITLNKNEQRIPYTLKDVVATQGIRTTFGDPKGVDYRPRESATVHTLLKRPVAFWYSGLVGMKATFGCISRFGVWASSWSTDQAGPLTRCVEDNALLLEILGVYDQRDPVSLNQPRVASRAGLQDGIKGVRIGVPEERAVAA